MSFAVPTADVVRWRYRRLVAAGCPVDLAAALAESGAIDLHALLDLIDRGCRPDLAARILAPLEPATSERNPQ
ncbi:MAG TPA: hypothetical protein VK279_13320 [Solirubrobacteraceae bacterium]|nr:hypothetical protein [Solirubrobacteraceae bacterium]